MTNAQNAEFRLCVSVLFKVGIDIGCVQLLANKINIAHAADAKNGEFTQF